MLDPLGRIGLLTLYLSIAAAQNFQYQGQRNYVEFAAPSSLHGIPNEAFRVPYPHMYESYRNDGEQLSQPSSNLIPGMSTSTDSSGRVITSLSMGLRRTKEDELNEIKIVPRERMIHGLRDANYKQGQEQVVPAAITTINSVKPRRKPRVEQRRRPTSEELYSDIFPSVIESPHIQLDSPTQFTKLRDVVPSSIEQKPANGMNPNSNSLVRVFAAQVPTAQIDPIDITKSMEIGEQRDKDIEDPLSFEESDSNEFVAGPLPPVHAMDSKENSSSEKVEETPSSPPPSTTTMVVTETTSSPTHSTPAMAPVMMVTPQSPSTVVPVPSGSLLPRGKLESIPSSLLADIVGDEEGAVVPNSERTEEVVKEEIKKLVLQVGEKEAEEMKEEMKREEMRKMEEEIKENQVKINQKRAARDEIVEKSGSAPVPITRMNNYRPPPPPVRREILMEPRCHYDPNLWAMHPKSAVTSATMFARSTGGTCEECLKQCMASQTAPWTCRSVTYDTEWKICDLFAISATANPFHLVEYKGRDYFEYLPASPPSDMDMKKMDEFSLIHKNEEVIKELKPCEVRLHELQMELAKLKGLSRSVHSYAITTAAPSLPFRQSGVNTEEYSANPLSSSDMMSVDGGVAEGSASLSMQKEAAKRTSDAMVMSSKKKELNMEEITPIQFRRRVGGKNRGGTRKMKRAEERMEKVDDEFNPRVGRITETHVHSDKNPMEAHKEYLREVKLSKVNARASAVSTSIGQTLKVGEMLGTDDLSTQLQLESQDVKNTEITGRTSANINMPKGGIKVHKIPHSFSINSGSSAEGEGYEKKNLVPPSPIEHESIGSKPILFDENHPEPLSGDQNKLPPLIDHPTWAILAASNRDQNTPVGAVVTSDPTSCRGHSHHVFVSFAQTDVVRIGQMKDCPVRTVEECARACDGENAFECVGFVVDILGCHLLSTRPDHRNEASFMRNSGATYAEKICMGGGSVHLHGILGAAREHLLIGTVTNMASTASLSQCM
ncbi:hypothetical protein PRIPAC_83031 [Pristionchus pacificus]|nr:hypothetical protein PRIPAC_83031 [Pristionchus pacificus]